MRDFYEFASSSPFLTFFLVLVVTHMIVGIFEAVFGKSK